MAVRPVSCLLILFVSGVFPALLAQSSRSPSTSGEIPRTFRLVATTSSGQPVTDLKPEDIQITDDGKHPAEAVRLMRDAASPSAQLQPREYSNRGASQRSSSVLILLDLLNANITERGSAWNETMQALEKQESPENIYLFLINPDATLHTVRAWQPPVLPGQAAETETRGPWTKQVRPMLEQALRQVERIKPTDLTAAPGLTVDPTFQALAMLAQLYAAVPGQKRVIWVTHGVPLTISTGAGPYDFTPELKQLGAEFEGLGIAMYTVHQLDRSTTGVRTDEVLQTLPGLTGGRWFENDSIGPALTAALTDARATYQTTYSVGAKQADGKYHKLRVSTTRKGVRISAPEGYTALAPEEIAKNKLQLVAARPFDTPDIGLRAALERSQAGARFQIHVDTSDLFWRGKGPYTGAIEVALAYLNAQGVPSLSSSPENIALNLNQQQFDAAQKDGYVVTIEKKPPAGAVNVRVIVQDAATGVAGSVTVPLGNAP